MFQRIAIIGLGLIGGSLGLALHKAQAAQQIVGYDQGNGVSAHACKRGAIDASYSTITETLRGADLVIFATPVGAMRTLLQNSASYLEAGAVVTDVASTKAQVITWAEEFLPSTVSFVGGHPMAGKELSGVEASDANLFKDHIYCLTPTAQTRAIAIEKVATMVEMIGAHVRFLEPAEHDKQVAGVSHLPFLASTALVNTVVADGTWEEAALLAASGFRDISRLAAGSPEMYRDICLTNSEAITRWLDAYITSLQELRTRIAARDKDLDATFAHARDSRQKWHDNQ